MAEFVHLHNHSTFSFFDGAARIEDLVAKTKELGMTALALTDHGNVHGLPEFQKEAKAAGVELETRVDADLPPVRGDSAAYGQVFLNLLKNALDVLQPRQHGEPRALGQSHPARSGKTWAPSAPGSSGAIQAISGFLSGR